MQQQRSKVFCLLEAFFPVWHLAWELGECEMLDPEQEHISWCELCALLAEEEEEEEEEGSQLCSIWISTLPPSLSEFLTLETMRCHGSV